jgi:addiction module HigA family antidote
MLASRSAPPHPGEVLLLKFLQPRGITQARFGQAVDMSGPNLNRFVKGGSGVSANMAWKFARALRTTPHYWMNLQVDFDLWEADPRRHWRSRPVRHRRWSAQLHRAK